MNELARLALNLSGRESRMLRHAVHVLLGGSKAENSLRFNPHVSSCSLCTYRTSTQKQCSAMRS
jgi:hypothetical protein